jgi:hypothetical protein
MDSYESLTHILFDVLLADSVSRLFVHGIPRMAD